MVTLVPDLLIVTWVVILVLAGARRCNGLIVGCCISDWAICGLIVNLFCSVVLSVWVTLLGVVLPSRKLYVLVLTVACISLLLLKAASIIIGRFGKWSVVLVIRLILLSMGTWVLASIMLGRMVPTTVSFLWLLVVLFIILMFLSALSIR